MRDSSQFGGSLLNTVGFILIAICVGSFVAYASLQIWHHRKMAEITTNMTEFFQKYQEELPELIKQHANISSPIALKSYGLLEKCENVQSMFDTQKSVCKLPLGELDVTTEYSQADFRTYIYVHFNDILKRRSCKQFLNANWPDRLPSSLWGERGYMGILSENTTGEIYYSNEAAEGETPQKPAPAVADFICKLCQNSRYCSIQFFFGVPLEEKVKFPSEFAGENKSAEGQEGKVTKEGENTYVKTVGDTQEVVTYNDNGTYSGATFTGGYAANVYEGTWTSQGITSYKSYTDVAKTNVSKQLDNIKYDKDGNVSSYEKDSQKYLLIGDSSDCLILDNVTNTKKLGDCSEPFKNEISFVVLNYDENGLLSEISSQGGEDALYKFIYDPMDGKLIGYCDKIKGGCRNVVDGKTVKDILKHNVPDTIGKFNTMYKDVKEESLEKPKRKKHKVLTREEAMKYVKEKDNQIKIKFK
ncbi:MAG TPA: hypothetical protein DIC64_04850 [Alphaproteobacteria bacterium]|nr:hypothetical protein [Alphaproteobacteria bacterium]